MDLLEQVKSEIKPNSSALKGMKSFVDKINQRIRDLGINAECIPGGSIAKGTYLKEDFDIDLFVKFDVRYENISDLLDQILKPYKPVRVHGSRDYFQISKYEIVPVLNIKILKMLKMSRI